EPGRAGWHRRGAPDPVAVVGSRPTSCCTAPLSVKGGGAVPLAGGVHTLAHAPGESSEPQAISSLVRGMRRRLNAGARGLRFPAGRCFCIALRRHHAFGAGKPKRAHTFGWIHRARRAGKYLCLLGRRPESTYF